MKIKLIAVMCFFITALFTTNASMAQSIVPATRNIEIYEGGMCETEVTIYKNGYRAVSRSYTSSDPNIVTITEIRYYDLTNGVIKWLFNLMGKKFGYAVITTAIQFVDEYGNQRFIEETIRVSVKWVMDLRQSLSALTDVTIDDAIKEDD